MGIHDHEIRKLGLLPHDRSDDQLLAVRWKAGTPPDVPARADFFAGVELGLDENDRFGDCGPTSVDNHRRVTTRALLGVEEAATLDAVFDLYRRSGNPNFDPATGADDNGVTMPALLGAARAGGLGGQKLVAYGKLHDLSTESIAAAIALFGGVLFAVDLQAAQQTQTVWDYSNSGEWGGHAVVAAAYDLTTGFIDVGSWAERIPTTAAFRENQLWEAWVPIWPETIGSHRFQANVDVDGLAEQFKSLTGGELPIPVAPPPAPVPSPVPAGGFPLVLSITDAALIDRLTRVAQRRGLTPERYVTAHFRHYFDLVETRQLGEF